MTVTCDGGYSLFGDVNLECVTGGTWDTTVGTCRKGKRQYKIIAPDKIVVFLLISSQNLCCVYPYEALQQGATNGYHNIGLCREIKALSVPLLKNTHL